MPWLGGQALRSSKPCWFCLLCDARRSSCKSECKNRGGKIRLLDLGISFGAGEEM